MEGSKKIGVFDSGLGGLFIANAIRARLPSYDYLYLGDTLHLPYGRRSDEAIYTLSENAMRYLLEEGCDLIVMACNTASAAALRRLQQGFLARTYPDKRILGVIVPTLEVAIEQGAHKIGLLATQRTVHSNIYEAELRKINPKVELYAVPSPLLVPLIEHEGQKYYDIVLEDYIAPLKAASVESLILGCTHYVAIKENLTRLLGGHVQLISQDEIIPPKLEDYLRRHLEMDARLSRGGTFEVRATDLNESFMKNIRDMVPQGTVIAEAVY